MKQRTLQTLYGYWNEARAGRLAPLRLEIEPSRIASILAETFMLERMDAATYQYRLAGTRLCELFGSELRGMNFLDNWSEADRAVLERQLSSLCEQGAAVVLTLEGSVDTRQRVEIEAILLPLLHGGNRVTRIIGAMSASSAPHWLHSEPLRNKHLLRHEIVWPDGRPHSIVERTGRQAPFLARLSGEHLIKGSQIKGNQRHFRVVEGGRSNGKFDKR